MPPTLRPPFPDFLPGWVATQRWYPAKGRTPSLRRIAGLRWQDPAGEVGIETHLVEDSSGSEPVVYHLPLTYRSKPLAGVPEHALVTTAQHSTLGKRWIYDACHDPVYAQALLDSLTGTGQMPAVSLAPGKPAPAGAVRGEPFESTDRRVLQHARVLTGEQSNTSIIIDDAVIIKVFRVLRPGINPDVEVHNALAAHGSTEVARPVGALWGSWPTNDDVVGGHLAFAVEFIPGVVDAWREALGAAEQDHDFTDAARSLGRATAAVHLHLRDAFGDVDAAAVAATSEQSDDLAAAKDRLVSDVRARFETACIDAPELRNYADAVERVIARALEYGDWPPVQRVHGDYHLGQVLDAPGRGWVLLDFEGEPLRPIAERTEPSYALRDVAGMLRSFDYAGGTAAPGLAFWTARTRAAFLDGYAQEHNKSADSKHQMTASDLATSPLLHLLELDKACYEASYEARNRPDWLSIPLEAIARLTQEDTMTDVTGTPANENPQPHAVDHDLLSTVARGEHHSPHEVLGAHLNDGVVSFRTVRHLAERVRFVTAEGHVDAHHELDGVWAAAMSAQEVPDYRIEVTYVGDTTTFDDPYRFLPSLGEVDQHLISEGRHERLWEVLGAHVRSYPSELGEVHGTSFSVWAPNARAVRVVGEFNSWDGTAHSMRSLGSTGVWELFVPEVGVNNTYKFEVCYPDGSWHAKADPMARATEHPPSTGSVVTASEYSWGDDQWMVARQSRDPHSGPMSIYEVHLGSWRQGLSYRDLATQLVEYVQWMGFTHVEFMPVAEHPFGGSWGYQVTSYYAPTSRFGSPDEFRHLVDALHQAGIGVLLDWVPAHFPKDSWALARFDGTPLYEDPDPMRGEQKDWGTYVFNFGRNEVRNFLVANALYWLTDFHIDGLRVDAVASMLYLDYSREPGQWKPNAQGGRENLEAIQFLQEVNATAYRTAPGIAMIAEESTAWPGVSAPTDAGGLGFGLKWNMGWMNDTLSYLAEEPINRRYHHGALTFSLVYAFSEKFVLPLSHDEVVHGKGSLLRKMPGDRWQQLAGVRALLAYQWSHPGKNLLFMGQEFAQEAEWSEGESLNWGQGDSEGHSGVRLALKVLNEVYAAHPALWADDFSPSGFEWLEANDGDHNVIAYLRKGTGADGESDVMAVIINFAGTPNEDYRVGLPQAGKWREVFNSDSQDYGGSGVGNLGSVTAEDVPWRGQRYSASLRVPPMGALFLSPG